MIDGDLYPTYIPNFLREEIDVRCGGEIRMYIAQPNFADGKYLVDCHVLTATGKPYDM
jgi:hypothetical protein